MCPALPALTVRKCNHLLIPMTTLVLRSIHVLRLMRIDDLKALFNTMIGEPSWSDGS